MTLHSQIHLQRLILLLPVMLFLASDSGACERRLFKPNRPMQQRADKHQLMLPARVIRMWTRIRIVSLGLRHRQILWMYGYRSGVDA